MAVPLDPARIRALLLDIEGTTTPIEFVTGVLFPYARTHLRHFLRQHGSSTEVAADLEALRREYAADERKDLDPPLWRDNPPDVALDSLVAYAHWLMDRDRKSAPLKSLQGKIWEAGYQSGELLSEVYADVPRAFARWRGQNRDLSIYSSGSVLAQKLLFTYTGCGDLTGSIRAYFDTGMGPKTEAESYQRIAAALALASAEIVFVSDASAELEAAERAGMPAVLCVRTGQAQPAAIQRPLIRTFDELFP